MSKKLFEYGKSFSRMGMAVVAALALTAGFASCGDDDDEGGSATPNTELGVLETISGKKVRLTGTSQLRYTYNSDGTLASFGYGTHPYEASYNPFTLTLDNNGSGFKYPDILVVSNIRTNGSGYITGCTEKYDYESSDSEEHESGSVSVSYNGNGNVTRIKGSGSGYYIEDGEKEKYSSSFDYSFTWSDGKLLKAVYTFGEDGEKIIETLEYDYDDAKANVTLQYVPNFLYVEPDSFLAGLFFIGYVGKGPSYFPTGVDYTRKDYDGTHNKYWDLSYTLIDGIVYRYEGWNDGEMSYSTLSGTSLRGVAKTPAATDKVKRSIFSSIHRRFMNR